MSERILYDDLHLSFSGINDSPGDINDIKMDGTGISRGSLPESLSKQERELLNGVNACLIFGDGVE